jgi:hypothetical protein
MKNLGKVLLAIGAIILIIAVVAKLVNAPVMGSVPTAIMGFADTCILLAIALFLAEEKK